MEIFIFNAIYSFLMQNWGKGGNLWCNLQILLVENDSPKFTPWKTGGNFYDTIFLYPNNFGLFEYQRRGNFCYHLYLQTTKNGATWVAPGASRHHDWGWTAGYSIIVNCFICYQLQIYLDCGDVLGSVDSYFPCFRHKIFVSPLVPQNVSTRLKSEDTVDEFVSYPEYVCDS